MKRLTVVLAAALLLTAVPALAQGQAQTGTAQDLDTEAILRTALDYSDGAYSGDAARMERALHPDLNKLIFSRRSPSTGMAAWYSTVSGLVEMTRLGAMTLDPDKRKTEAAVLEAKDGIASVKVRTSQWCDYLQMIKAGGQWKIVNVLWTLGVDTPAANKVVPGFDGEKERPAAGAAVLDYLEGLLSGDVTRLEKALHPETNQVVFLMAGENGAAILNRIRYSGLLESAKAKLDPPPEGARKAEVRVLDLMDGMAFAAAQAGIGEAYLQLQLLDGQWKAINVLLRPTRNLLQLPPRKK
jgi:hypothetical protein